MPDFIKALSGDQQSKPNSVQGSKFQFHFGFVQYILINGLNILACPILQILTRNFSCWSVLFWLVYNTLGSILGPLGP
jgi:hypothetical protein